MKPKKENMIKDAEYKQRLQVQTFSNEWPKVSGNALVLLYIKKTSAAILTNQVQN